MVSMLLITVSMEIMKFTGPAGLKEHEEAPPMKALLPSRSGMLKVHVCFDALTELCIFHNNNIHSKHTKY